MEKPLWTQPIVAVPVAAAMLLATAAAWLALALVPEMRRERDLARDEARRSGAAAARAAAPGAAAPREGVEPNIPVVIVQGTGARGGPVAVRVPDDAVHVVLWIEAPSATGTYRLTLTPADREAPVETVDGLVPNSERALAVAVPAAPLSGEYRARLYQSGSGQLAGQYRLAFVRSHESGIQ